MYRPLHDGWTLRAGGDEPTGPPELRDAGAIPATVPGCVHTDLLAAGLIDDPFLDDNETRLGWIGRTDWVYELAFDWHADEHDRTDLVCDGLDTVATLLLNGQELGRTANMHRAYRFGVRELLREGRNALQVTFRAPYAYAEEQRERHGARPSPYDEPY
ncbi:MAG: glycoside hydrolase family 2 protein, partial [Nonomuraea sp.]|nr:glycoside hydrolase family 2 protein [Nonomuraea sp.]